MKKEENIFPNVNTLAYYHCFDHYIMYNSIESTDLDTIRINFQNDTITFNDTENLATIAHEIRHWCDHIGTLTGMTFLIKQFEAMNAKISVNEYEFYKIRDYFNYVNLHELKKYYTTKEMDYQYQGPNTRWRWNLSAGRGFDFDGKPDETKPKFFISFNTINDKRILRFPITLTSLWELNARNSEFDYLLSFISKHPEKTNWLQEKLKKSIYHPDLVLYSGAVHLYSNVTNVVDIIEAYKGGSCLSSFILNLPDEFLDEIPHTDECEKYWGKKIEYFKKRHDRGFAYYSILELFKKHNLNPSNIDDYDKLLTKISLPSVVELKNVVLKKYTEAENMNYHPSIDNYFHSLIIKGKYAFEKLGFWGKDLLMLDAFSDKNIRPNVYFGDTLELTPEFEKWKDFADKLYDNLKEFNDVCGI